MAKGVSHKKEVKKPKKTDKKKQLLKHPYKNKGVLIYD